MPGKSSLILLLWFVMFSFSLDLYAEDKKCAIFFFEYEHEDAEKEGYDEYSAYAFSSDYLKNDYDKFYRLVNESATKDNFEETLQEAVDHYDIVDVFIHAHGGMQFFRGHFDDKISVDDILSYGSYNNIHHLRLVYIGTCHGFDIADEFVEIGADVGIGADTKMVNFPFFPLFLYHFAELNKTAGASVLQSTITPGEKFRVSGNKSIRMNP